VPAPMGGRLRLWECLRTFWARAYRWARRHDRGDAKVR
jgi:hypothetical protein